MSWLRDNWESNFKDAAVGAVNQQPVVQSDVNYDYWDAEFNKASDKAMARSKSHPSEAQKMQSLNKMMRYDIAPEAQQMQDIFQENAAGLRETGADLESMTSARAGMSQYGAAFDQRDAMRESTGAAVRDITQLGGSSASVAGTASRLGAQNIGAMREIATQNQMFRDQAQRDYLQALNERVGLEAQATGQEAQGLQSMISEKDKVYQSKLERIRMAQQFTIANAGNVLAGQ